MEIFRNGPELDGFEILKADLKVLTEAFKQIKTRAAEKALETCMENISDGIYMSLTVEAATEIERINSKHPDSDAIDLIDFLIWKTNFKIMTAEEFNSTTSMEVGEGTKEVRVYKDDYYIEVLEFGKHMLVIETSCWMEPSTSLEDMELELYNYVNLNDA